MLVTDELTVEWSASDGATPVPPLARRICTTEAA